jgi:cell division protein FtsW (lipid II flippase)
MWVRRSQKEIEQFNRSQKMRRFSIGWPLVLSSLGTALSMLCPELRSITVVPFVFLLTFLIAYLSQIVFGRFFVVIAPTFDLFTIPKSDLICTNCKTVHLYADKCSLLWRAT